MAISRTMAEGLPFASASDVAERAGGFNSVRGNAFRDDGRNESAVVQVIYRVLAAAVTVYLPTFLYTVAMIVH